MYFVMVKTSHHFTIRVAMLDKVVSGVEFSANLSWPSILQEYTNIVMSLIKTCILLIIHSEKLLLFHIFTFIPLKNIHSYQLLQAFNMYSLQNSPKIFCGCEAICENVKGFTVNNKQYTVLLKLYYKRMKVIHSWLLFGSSWIRIPLYSQLDIMNPIVV